MPTISAFLSQGNRAYPTLTRELEEVIIIYGSSAKAEN